MQLVDEYLRNAKRYRDLARNSMSPLREAYARIADEWEELAKARLAVVQKEIEKIAPPTPSPKPKRH